MPLPAEWARPLLARVPSRGREAVLAAHDAALAAGRPGYSDPRTGLFVMTAAYLWDRGSCCESGCRHCPFTDGPRA